MQAFTDFILQVTYPPNPIRSLDNSLTADEQAGRDFYFNHTPDGQEIPSDGFHNCNGCHVLDPSGNAQFGVAKPGFFGSDGRYSFEAQTQFFKVPHLRNMYQKVGMFGMDNTFNPNDTSGLAQILPTPYTDNSFAGDQVRGFGFLHDGSVDTMFRFHAGTPFARRDATSPLPNLGGFPIVTDPGDPIKAAEQLQVNITLRRQVEAFLLAFDSNLAPIVGQQATLTADSGDDVLARVDLLKARVTVGECDLVVSGVIHGRRRGFLMDVATGLFSPDSAHARPLTDSGLRALARDGELTFTAVPPGAGRRIGIDRDLDGVLNGDR